MACFVPSGQHGQVQTSRGSSYSETFSQVSAMINALRSL